MSTEIEYVKVNNLSELKRAIYPYSKDGRPESRKLMVEGLEFIKKATAAHEQAEREILENKDAFSGFMPAQMVNPMLGYHWVDSIIEKKLGGKRSGYIVRWELADGTYEWDAIEDELVSCGN